MKTILSLLVTFFLAITPAFAASTPEAAATEAIAKMQMAKDLLVVLDYVHWETAFKMMSSAERADLNVSSASELRSLYRKLVADPASYLRSNVLAVQAATSFGGPIVEAMAQGFAFSVEKAKQQIVGAIYTVSSISSTSNAAYVEISASGSLGQYQKKVQLIKIQDKWYVPSPREFDSQGYLQKALSGKLL